MSKKKQYYVVVRGHRPGLYTQWEGAGGAAEQVQRFPHALYKGFHNRADAIAWLKTLGEQTLAQHAPNLLPLIGKNANQTTTQDQVIIYTDGGSLGNPGPGGYGVVLKYGRERRELSGGFRLTTNNRMELMACIVALQTLQKPCTVTLHSDSKYVVDGITKGWARRWQSKGWMRTKSEPAKNADLWKQLLAQCERHKVTFKWVRGHAGNKENERCDELAVAAAQGQNLPPDPGYEARKD